MASIEIIKSIHWINERREPMMLTFPHGTLHDFIEELTIC